MLPLDARRGLALVLLSIAVMLLWYVFAGDAGEQSAEPALVRAYPVRDWKEPRQRELNISLFTFGDRNRDGRYDTGDLPMASVAVKLLRPGDSSLTHRSNINGFANFDMSWQRDGADISHAGEDYGLEVLVPPGWVATTGNVTQVVRFERLQGSVTGLVAESPPAAVGFTPVLTLAGRVSVPGDIRLRAIDPLGREIMPAQQKNGAFTLGAQPGNWQLLVEHVPTGAISRRDIVVSDAPVQLAALQAGAQRPERLSATFTQDFEYLTRSDIGKVPGGMGGLDWDYLIAVDNQVYNGPGFVNALRSGKNVGYNSSGHPVTITPAPGRRHFDFVGAWFAAAWPEAEGETLVVEAWRGGKSVASEAVALSYLGPVWFDADFRRIDKLRLSTKHYWQFVTDDMVFRLEGPIVEPAPGQ